MVAVSVYGTVLVVRRQRRDSDGDVIGTPTDTELPGWVIAPAGSSEQADGTREATADRLDAYGGPPNPDIQPGDRVYLAGDDRAMPPPWYVVGNPDGWAGLGWNPGQVVTLQRHRG